LILIYVGKIGLYNSIAFGSNAVSLPGTIFSRSRRWFTERGTFDGYRIWQECTRDRNNILFGSKFVAWIL